MPNMIWTGPRAILKIAGKKVATATGVTFNESIEYDTVRVLDLLEVLEFAEAQYNASVSCDTVRIIGSSPTQLNIMPHVDLLSILTQPELICELYDNVSGTPVAVAEGIKINNNNFSVNAGQVVANNLTFVCKRIKDVSEMNGGQTPASGNTALG
jgi:hypothetical protein